VKLLLINYEYPPIGGGAGNATRFMSRALAHLGHEPTVLTTAFDAHRGESFDEGVCVVRLPARRGAADRSNMTEMGSFLYRALRSAPRIAWEKRIEGAIAYFTVPCGPVAWLLNRRSHLPYVVSLRGGDVPGFVPELNWIHQRLSPFRRAVLRSALAIVANSDSLAQLSEAADPFRVQMIPNGADAKFFSPSTARVPSQLGTMRILFVGRMAEQKNLPLLIDALAEMRWEFGDRVSVDVVGDGPRREQWERKAATAGVAASFRWHGWLDKAPLRDLYRMADCFVNPSLYEGMPNTVLEAMACALPVVASDIGGNDALVVQDKTGILFSLERPKAFREALAALARDAQLRHRLGRNGRTRVLEHFTWERVAKSYADLFHDENRKD
jgi:glycosyltransferase involved in cell wall biosynthesis